MPASTSPPPRFRVKSHLRHLARVGMFLVFLYIIIRMIDLPVLKDALEQVRLEILALASAVYFGNIAIRAYRLQRIFPVKGRAIRFRDAYTLTLVGVALNMLIPATLGDIARSYYGYKMYGFKEEMLSTVLVDKMFALCSLFVLGGISGLAMGYPLLGIVSVVGAALTFIPLLRPRLVPWTWLNAGLRYVKRSLDADRLIAAFTLPASLKAEMLLISIGGWLCTCLYFYIVCTAFPVTVSLWYVIVIMPMLTIARLFPFTVNALGPMEMAVAYFFGLIGIPPTLAVVVSLTSNLLSSVVPGTLGVVALLTARKRMRDKTEVS